MIDPVAQLFITGAFCRILATTLLASGFELRGAQLPLLSINRLVPMTTFRRPTVAQIGLLAGVRNSNRNDRFIVDDVDE